MNEMCVTFKQQPHATVHHIQWPVNSPSSSLHYSGPFGHAHHVCHLTNPHVWHCTPVIPPFCFGCVFCLPGPVGQTIVRTTSRPYWAFCLLCLPLAVLSLELTWWVRSPSHRRASPRTTASASTRTPPARTALCHTAARGRASIACGAPPLSMRSRP